jgi:hypothetical protein
VLEGLHLEVKWYLHETALFDVPYDTNLQYGKMRCRPTEMNCLPKACHVRRQKIINISIFLLSNMTHLG